MCSACKPDHCHFARDLSPTPRTQGKAEGDNEPHKLPSDLDIHITHTYHARSCTVIINLNFNVVIIREETECEHSKLRKLNSL